MSTTISVSSFNEFYTQLGKIFDFCKVITRLWDDLMDFFLVRTSDGWRVLGL